ncbi:thrombospondin type 3 repeat-containing protein [Chryseobacterium luquanense]|uniref:thrombospondin type 3 repeat-containing protein n=1 Tax=Chryseobacterium luquanense TaxID=2983766 RepID=UPI0035CC2488
MKIYYTFFLLFIIFCTSAQEIIDKEAFKKCKKEFNKKICLSDEDGDGVLFYLDHCPKEAGSAENDGCPWPDTDGDGILDKDDACPTIPGIPAEDGCPKKVYHSHRYSQEELDEVKKKFLEKTKNINYDKLADFIFSKIDLKGFESRMITLEIASFSQMAGCGQDRTDYSPTNLRVNLASELFWNESNFKKFVNKFPSKIVFPYSENEDINKKVQSFKKIYFKKSNGQTFYNAKNNFKELNNKEINPYRKFNIYIFFEENDEIFIKINENSNLEQKYFRLQAKGNTFIQLN